MRLIDADEIAHEANQGIILALTSLPNNQKRELLILICKFIQDTIEIAPTVDAVPVKHGYWEEVKCKTILDKAVFSHTLKCSECGKWKFGNVLLTQRFYYCPNCGAKMEGGDKNDSKDKAAGSKKNMA